MRNSGHRRRHVARPPQEGPVRKVEAKLRVAAFDSEATLVAQPVVRIAQDEHPVGVMTIAPAVVVVKLHVAPVLAARNLTAPLVPRVDEIPGLR